MPQTITVGDVSARPGETKYGPATWVELRDGTRVYLPVIIVNGSQDGPRLVLTSATHPVEISPVAAVHLITRKKIDPTKLKGNVIAFPIANPLGMQFGEYVSPHDGVNLVVSYPGSKDGSVTQRFANFIWENAAKDATAVLDLHENTKPCLYFSVVASAKDQATEVKQIELANAFGITVIKTLVFPPTPGRRPGDINFSAVCGQNGIPAFNPEFEGSSEMNLSETDTSVTVAARGIMNVMKKLGMIPGTVEPQTGIQVMKGDFEGAGMTRANRGGIVRRMADVGVKIPKGTPIAKVINAYGDEVETITMPIDGYIWAWTIGSPVVNRNWAVQTGGTVCFVFKETS